MLQMRADGYLGFPGGFVDPGETVVEGLHREIFEEAGVKLQERGIVLEPNKHWICSLVRPKSGVGASVSIVNHFFAVEVPPQIFDSIYSTTKFDDEVLGHVKVPLYTLKDVDSGGAEGLGLPAFLDNLFAGCARPQLLLSLVKCGIMTQEEVDEAVKASKTRPSSECHF